MQLRPPVASHQRHDELASAGGGQQTNEAGRAAAWLAGAPAGQQARRRPLGFTVSTAGL